MKKFLMHNGIYISLYLVMLLFCGYFLWHYGKVQIHQTINAKVGNIAIDTFFKYITHIGDGLFAVMIIVLLLFINVRKALYVLLSFALASGLTQILKNFVFIDVWRPQFVFQFYARAPLNLIEGVDLNIGDSFPSGHSTGAFALFIALLLLSKNHFIKMTCFILACLAAYSRTHLSQHWLIDIYVGSIIGFSFALFFYVIFYSKKYTEHLDKSIIQLIFKTKRV